MKNEDKEPSEPLSPHWLERLARIYRQRRAVSLPDDAGSGIDPRAKRYRNGEQVARSSRQIAGVCVALGMGVVGVVMILLADIDQEPTSSLPCSLLEAQCACSVAALPQSAF